MESEKNNLTINLEELGDQLTNEQTEEAKRQTLRLIKKLNRTIEELEEENSTVRKQLDLQSETSAELEEFNNNYKIQILQFR